MYIRPTKNISVNMCGWVYKLKLHSFIEYSNVPPLFCTTEFPWQKLKVIFPALDNLPTNAVHAQLYTSRSPTSAHVIFGFRNNRAIYTCSLRDLVPMHTNQAYHGLLSKEFSYVFLCEGKLCLAARFPTKELRFSQLSLNLRDFESRYNWEICKITSFI